MRRKGDYMKFENTRVMNFDGALRGMRNPMNSWDKSDSRWERVIIFNDGIHFDGTPIENVDEMQFIIGENDLALAQRLIRAGSEHRKFMRQIFVCVDITAPAYFMAELDTYKVGTVRNSCSFMHKGVSKSFEIEDFEVDDDKIIEILSTRKENKKNKLFYPYETDDYKIYKTQNGRKYRVYKNGRIVSEAFSVTDGTGRTRNFPEKEVTPSIRKDGYWEVNIGGRNGERWLLHRLIGFVWIDNKNNLETIDHIDNNKNNNCVENLEWVSREENVKRQIKDGLARSNNLNADYKNWKMSSKCSPFDRIQIKQLFNKGVSQKELSQKFEMSQTQISVIVRDVDSTSKNRELFEKCWVWETIINTLNELRDKYLDTKDYQYFRAIRQILPQSYLYKSTITLNYENLLAMCSKGQRRFHKLNEWSGQDDPSLPNFISWARTLPYAQKLIFIDELQETINA